MFVNIKIPIRFISVVLATIVTLLLIALGSQATFAQEQADIDTTTSTTVVSSHAGVATEYKFVAKPCDSLTKLVRKSILIYDEANSDIKLSQEAILYAETNIVQNMGAYLLDIGDEVAVSSQEIASFANSSQELSQSQIDAWGMYVSGVDFDLDHTQDPFNIDEVVADAVDDTTDTPTQSDVEDIEEENSVSAFWWFGGIGSAVVIWYLLWKREDN